MAKRSHKQKRSDTLGMNIDDALKLAFKYHQQEYLQQAEELYNDILKVNPRHVQALNYLGLLYYRLKRHDLAITHIEKAVEIEPNYADAYNNLGVILMDAGQYDEALSCYQKAITINPNSFFAYYNLGNFLKERGYYEQAMISYNKATELNPELSEAYYNLGTILHTKALLGEAINNFRTSLRINPKSTVALNCLGNALSEQGRLDEAESCYRAALDLNPLFFPAYSNLLLSMLHGNHNAEAIFSAHVNFAENYEKPLTQHRMSHDNLRQADRRLRVGYLSPDFREHPVAHFIEPVIKAHDRDHFEVFCYSNSLIKDDVTKRIENYSDVWRDILQMNDEQAAALINDDRIDVLVDLAGHTANNRILLFARKPAPLQITWLGYPSTTGLSTINYRVTDFYADPPGMTEFLHSELLLRLPETSMCYLPCENAPGIKPLPALKAGVITFGSRNKLAKISLEVLSVWAAVLRNVPGSRFLIKARGASDTPTREYIFERLRQESIDITRIAFEDFDPSPGYLEAYNRIDICLDTFPFNGITTTCEALWMGVPVISLAGSAYAARGGVSILSNVGLPELIATTKNDYIDIAVKLAKDIERLSLLRMNLRNKMAQSPMTDASRFIGNLEKCYRKIWRDWCSSNLDNPEPVNPN